MKSALIAINHYNARDLKALSSIVRALKKDYRVEKASSIYEMLTKDVSERAKSISPIGQGLVMVAAIHFEIPMKNLVQSLEVLEAKQSARLQSGQIRIELLAVEDEISMLPTLPLPHPDLHKKAAFLVPASEIMAHYEHPVLEESLEQLLGRLKQRESLVFYARSSQLFDLS